MFAEPHAHSKPPPRVPRDAAPLATADFFAREATVLTLALTGLDCHVVRVTARLEDGPATFEIAGLSEPRMRETRVRVRAGLTAAGSAVPAARITVRFDRPELIAGGTADLAIVVAVLVVTGRVDPDALSGVALVGELTLTGTVRGVRGTLPMLTGAAQLGISRAIVSRESGPEAAYATAVQVSLIGHLAELVRHLREGVPLERLAPAPQGREPAWTGPDFADVRGLTGPRRALEVAAAGGHHILMTGPQGCGRTLLARRLPGLLPEMTEEEALEVTAIYSVAGLTSRERPFVASRPFRAPHHTVSMAGLLGGGDPVRPGEVTLAHRGVLLLEDALDFRPSNRESLAFVLRDSHTTIVRAGARVRFPADTLAVCATSPCPCGHLGSDVTACTCPPERVAAYLSRLRLPLFELLDVRFSLPEIAVAVIQSAPRGEPSVPVRERVARARAVAAERARELGGAATNAALTPSDLERVATPDGAGALILTTATEQLRLSEAQVRRVMRVARTIADLDGKDAVTAPHVAEAVALAITDDARLMAPTTHADDDHAA